MRFMVSGRCCSRTASFILVVVMTAVAAPDGSFKLRFGLAKFAAYNPLEDIDKLADWGFDYSEPAVTQTMELSDRDFESVLAKARAARIRVEAMNWFVVADIKLTGPSVDQAKVRAYVEKSLARAEALGAKVIVFGSGGARSIPEGFPREQAWQQLISFLRLCGDHIATKGYGMVIGIEPLRRAESNVVNSVAEAWRLARDVNHPKVRIIADFFHMAVENEDPAIILQARDAIVHCHISNPNNGRVFPRDESEDVRYAAFFRALSSTGYDGRLSVEANTNDLESDARAGLAFMKRMYEKYR